MQADASSTQIQCKRLLLTAVLLSTLSTLSAAVAGEEDHDLFRFNMGLALAHGGDDLARIEFETETDGKISAGGGVKAYIGLFIDPDIPIKALFNVGLHAENEEADDGKASMERYFLDSILLYQAHRFHRLGVGASYHMQPTLQVNDHYSNYIHHYDDAVGWLIQYEYVFKPKTKGVPTIGLRYTDISYTAKESGKNINAAHHALHINYAF